MFPQHVYSYCLFLLYLHVYIILIILIIIIYYYTYYYYLLFIIIIYYTYMFILTEFTKRNKLYKQNLSLS